MVRAGSKQSMQAYTSSKAVRWVLSPLRRVLLLPEAFAVSNLMAMKTSRHHTLVATRNKWNGSSVWRKDWHRTLQSHS